MIGKRVRVTESVSEPLSYSVVASEKRERGEAIGEVSSQSTNKEIRNEQLRASRGSEDTVRKDSLW